MRRSPIFYSVIRGDLLGCKEFIRKRCFLDFEDYEKKSLIDHARDKKDILEFLVESGESFDIHSPKSLEILFEAIYSDHLDLFKQVIKRGVPFSSLDPETGESTLISSYIMKSKRIFHFLLSTNEYEIFSMAGSYG